jgi:hypothetical protein
MECINIHSTQFSIKLLDYWVQKALATIEHKRKAEERGGGPKDQDLVSVIVALSLATNGFSYPEILPCMHGISIELD